MSERENSAAAFVDRLKRQAPELLDLLTAETETDFERAFDALLEKAVGNLESNKKKFEALDEDGLSSALAMALTMPGLTVVREAYSNGHVDLTIEADHCVPQRRKLGEAKIYDGPEKHIKGLEQLLTRYTTGREGRGLLIVYFRKQGVADLVKKIRERMDSDLPLQQRGATTDHLLKWSFLSKHAHSCGEDLAVGHIACNLYADADGSANTDGN
jgi:hypothetical protein